MLNVLFMPCNCKHVSYEWGTWRLYLYSDQFNLKALHIIFLHIASGHDTGDVQSNFNCLRCPLSVWQIVNLVTRLHLAAFRIVGPYNTCEHKHLLFDYGKIMRRFRMVFFQRNTVNYQWPDIRHEKFFNTNHRYFVALGSLHQKEEDDYKSQIYRLVCWTFLSSYHLILFRLVKSDGKWF